MITQDVPNISKELAEVLPSLTEYMVAKEEFRNKTITQEGVNLKLQKLVVNINEFLVLLKSYCTDPSETDILRKIKL